MDKFLQDYVEGNITGEEFEAKQQTFTEDEKKVFEDELAKPGMKDKLATASKKELEKLSALRKEKNRVQDRNTTDSLEKFRTENIDRASKEFFSKFNIPVEEQASYVEEFQKNDKGSVNADLIVGDFKKIYATKHADELLDTKTKFDSFQGSGADFNRDNAGNPGGTGGGTSGGESLDKAAKDIASESKRNPDLQRLGMNVDEESAKRIASQGTGRTFSLK